MQNELKNESGVLVLNLRDSNGKLIQFEGQFAGNVPSILSYEKDKGYGEVVFNTSMTGYQEILTDPSYYGQIIVMTYPHIGNTGFNLEDEESARLWNAGLVVTQLEDIPSNWRSKGTLQSYLLENKIPVLTNVNTRALTRILRTEGVVRGIILKSSNIDQAEQLFSELPLFENRNLIQEVSTKLTYEFVSKQKTPSSKKFRIVAMDFGIKTNLLECLHSLGCSITVVPFQTSAEEILKLKPDGLFLSNGPGDPSSLICSAVPTVSKLLGQLPIFGVCMGHQVLGMAIGAKTYKLKFGHRGGNHPVLVESTQSVEISSHNHGYAIDEKTLPNFAQVTHINLNDCCVEGIAIPEKNAFSVQYHPEASPGPHDSMGLFNQFIEQITKCSKNT